MNRTGALDWRAMGRADLDAVCAVAKIAFPDHPEDRAVFAERLALSPGGCFVLAADDQPARGYLIAYPWRLDDAPPLNAAIGRLPDVPEVLYLHDLALAPEVRGGGHAARMAQRLADQASRAGWPAIALVAVNQAARFWEGLGFERREGADMARKLASYGDGACYMLRKV